jgi:hypothetical protein
LHTRGAVFIIQHAQAVGIFLETFRRLHFGSFITNHWSLQIRMTEETSPSSGSDPERASTIGSRIIDAILYPANVVFMALIYIPFLYATLFQSIRDGVAVDTNKWQEELSQTSWIFAFTVTIILLAMCWVIPTLGDVKHNGGITIL